jgi:quercetin dioxygenase-like cupin family protein
MKNETPDLVPDFVREAMAQDGEPSQAELAHVEGVLALVAMADVPAMPSRGVKERLLATASTGPMRYAPMFDRLARLFDLGVEAVVQVLERADIESEWEPGPDPNIGVFHLTGGPSLATADVGLVKMPAGFAWPGHRHRGDERVLVLEGAYRDSAGSLYRAGDLHEMSAGTEHAFVVLPEKPLVFALVLHAPIEML